MTTRTTIPRATAIARLEAQIAVGEELLTRGPDVQDAPALAEAKEVAHEIIRCRLGSLRRGLREVQAMTDEAWATAQLLVRLLPLLDPVEQWLVEHAGHGGVAINPSPTGALQERRCACGAKVIGRVP